MYSTPARIFSFILASVLAMLVTFYPPAVSAMQHGVITLVIWGVCAGFVHGLCFDPENRYWRAIFSPIVAWCLMGFGLFRIGAGYGLF
jgi:cyd operon protein YbgE